MNERGTSDPVAPAAHGKQLLDIIALYSYALEHGTGVNVLVLLGKSMFTLVSKPAPTPLTPIAMKSILGAAFCPLVRLVHVLLPLTDQ